jgi:predicted nucleic acid-binding protein
VNVLVDTSVWVGHFKQNNEHLVALLEQGCVVSHPYVVVELACGTPPNRNSIIALLSLLGTVTVATPGEVLLLIERRGPFGRRCGFVDLSLLASILLHPQTRLWTLDQRLQSVADEAGRSYRPQHQS